MVFSKMHAVIDPIFGSFIIVAQLHCCTSLSISIIIIKFKYKQILAKKKSNKKLTVPLIPIFSVLSSLFTAEKNKNGYFSLTIN